MLSSYLLATRLGLTESEAVLPQSCSMSEIRTDLADRRQVSIEEGEEKAKEPSRSQMRTERDNMFREMYQRRTASCSLRPVPRQGSPNSQMLRSSQIRSTARLPPHFRMERLSVPAVLWGFKLLLARASASKMLDRSPLQFKVGNTNLKTMGQTGLLVIIRICRFRARSHLSCHDPVSREEMPKLFNASHLPQAVNLFRNVLASASGCLDIAC